MRLVSIINQINEGIGKAVSWLTTLLVFVVFGDVTFRYLFKSSSATLVELEWHLFALIFMLAAGYTLKADRHVRVDVFYANFSRRRKAWVNALGTLFFLLPFCYIVLEATLPYVKISYVLNEGSPDPGGLPARYLIKGSIFVGFALLALQGIAVFSQNILIILGQEKAQPEEVGTE
jgi:TRAP-type mannitol/chloroaromatic compound transport system permease small subunit